MSHLTPEENLDDYHAAFEMFDRDNSGAISMTELGDVMRKFGMHPSDEDLQDIINEHDSDHSGQIEFDEFIEIMRKMKNDTMTSQEDNMRAAFQAFDQDGSGTISADEMREVMAKLGQNLTDEEIEEMISEADTDGDGQIDYTEFVKMWKECS